MPSYFSPEEYNQLLSGSGPATQASPTQAPIGSQLGRTVSREEYDKLKASRATAKPSTDVTATPKANEVGWLAPLTESLKGLARGTVDVAKSVTGAIPEMAGGYWAAQADVLRQYPAAIGPGAMPPPNFDYKAAQTAVQQAPTPNPMAGQAAAAEQFFAPYANAPSIQANPTVASTEYLGNAPLWTKATKLASDVGQGAPSVAAAIGGAMVGGPAGAGVMGGALTASPWFEKARKEGLGEKEALAGAAVIGGGSAILNSVPFLEKLPDMVPAAVKGRIATFVAKGLAEAGTETAEGGLNPFAEVASGQRKLNTLKDFETLLVDAGKGIKAESGTIPASFLLGGMIPGGANKEQAPTPNVPAKVELASEASKIYEDLKKSTDPRGPQPIEPDSTDALYEEIAKSFEAPEQALVTPQEQPTMASEPIAQPEPIPVTPERGQGPVERPTEVGVPISPSRASVRAQDRPYPGERPTTTTGAPQFRGAIRRRGGEAVATEAMPSQEPQSRAVALPSQEPVMEAQSAPFDLTTMPMEQIDAFMADEDARMDAKEQEVAKKYLTPEQQKIFNSIPNTEYGYRRKAKMFSNVSDEASDAFDNTAMADSPETASRYRQVEMLREKLDKFTAGGTIEDETEANKDLELFLRDANFDDPVDVRVLQELTQRYDAAGLDVNKMLRTARAAYGTWFYEQTKDANDALDMVASLDAKLGIPAQAEESSAAPAAEFVGLQERSRGQEPIALYNIPTPEGGKTTVTAETAKAQGYSVPEQPQQAVAETPKEPPLSLGKSFKNSAQAAAASDALDEVMALGEPNPMNPREVVIDGVRVEPTTGNGRLVIKSMVSMEQGSGAGSRALARVLDIADANDVEVALSPTQIGNTPESRLRDFYSRFGFEESRQGQMIRKPNTNLAGQTETTATTVPRTAPASREEIGDRRPAPTPESQKAVLQQKLAERKSEMDARNAVTYSPETQRIVDAYGGKDKALEILKRQRDAIRGNEKVSPETLAAIEELTGGKTVGQADMFGLGDFQKAPKTDTPGQTRLPSATETRVVAKNVPAQYAEIPGNDALTDFRKQIIQSGVKPGGSFTAEDLGYTGKNKPPWIRESGRYTVDQWLEQAAEAGLVSQDELSDPTTIQRLMRGKQNTKIPMSPAGVEIPGINQKAPNTGKPSSVGDIMKGMGLTEEKAKAKTSKAKAPSKWLGGLDVPAEPAPEQATIAKTEPNANLDIETIKSIVRSINGDPWVLSGPRLSDKRQQVMSALKGVKVPKSQSGVTAIREELRKIVGVPANASGYTEQEMFKEWASSKPAEASQQSQSAPATASTTTASVPKKTTVKRILESVPSDIVSYDPATNTISFDPSDDGITKVRDAVDKALDSLDVKPALQAKYEEAHGDIMDAVFSKQEEAPRPTKGKKRSGETGAVNIGLAKSGDVVDTRNDYPETFSIDNTRTARKYSPEFLESAFGITKEEALTIDAIIDATGVDKNMFYVSDSPTQLFAAGGATSFKRVGVKKLRAAILEGAPEHKNPAFALHEVGHVLQSILFDENLPQSQRGNVTLEDIEIAKKWAGVTYVKKNGEWNGAAEEKFSLGFQKYIETSKAPIPALERVFSKMKEWMGRVFFSLMSPEYQGWYTDAKITPEIQGVFDRMLGKKEAQSKSKTRNDQLGAVNIGLAKDAAKKVLDIVKKAASSKSIEFSHGLGKDTKNANVVRVGTIARLVSEGEQAVIDFNEGYRTFINEGKGRLKSAANRFREAPEDMREMLNRFLIEQDPEVKQARLEALPEPMRESAVRMRTTVDALSRQLRNEGVASKATAEKIENQEGYYLRRTFKIFKDPDWKNQISEKMKDAVRRHIAKEEELDPSSTEVTRILNGYMNIADNTEPSIVRRGKKLGTKDLSTLQKRGEFDQSILDLWGVEQDGIVNFLETLTAQANLIANHRFLRAVARIGEGKTVFSADLIKAHTEVDTDPSHPDFNAEYDRLIRENRLVPFEEGAPKKDRFNPSEIGRYGAMAGSMVERDFKEAMQEAVAHHEITGMLGELAFLNSVTKAGMTALSPKTASLNFWSNSFIAAQAHHLFYGSPKAIANRMRLAMKVARIETSTRHDKGIRTLGNKLIGLGVLKDTIGTTELQKQRAETKKTRLASLMKKAPEMADSAIEKVYGADPHIFKSISNALGMGVEQAFALYQAGDDVWKTFGWLAERDMLKEAYPNWSDRQLDVESALRVRRFYTTYSELPNAVKALRHNPLIAPFVAFYAEVPRGMANTMLQAKQDIVEGQRTGNTVLRNQGLKRAGSMMVAAATLEGISQYYKMKNDVDDDDEETLRMAQPSWDKAGTFGWYDIDRVTGKAKAYNLSAMVPQAIAFDPLTAFFRAETIGQGVHDFAKELSSPLYQPEIGFMALRNQWYGIDSDNKPIFTESDPMGEQWYKRGAQFWKDMSPGAYKSVVNVSKAEDKVGKAFDELSGQRTVEIDLPKSLFYKAIALQKAGQEQNRDIGKAVKAEDRDAIMEQYKQRVEAHKLAWSEASDMIKGMKRFGVDNMLIVKTLKEAGFDTPRDRNRLINGNYVEPKMPDWIKKATR